MEVKKIKFDAWEVSTIVLAILFVIILMRGGITGRASELSPQQATDKAIEWISNFFQSRGQNVEVTLVDVKDVGSVYQFTIRLTGSQGSQEATYFVSKDGKYFFPQGILTTQQIQAQIQQPQTPQIPKRDKPDVKLFVMSYCPFGLQAEKAMLPVMKLLGDKADILVHFVYYAMHGKKEIDENLRQYCIQKNQKDKYYDYLLCFVQSGDYEKCLSETNIDQNKLQSCIDQTDKQYKIYENYNNQNTWYNGRFPRFDVELDLNQRYGIRGSPTIVINDKVVQLTRSPEAFKQAICSAFNNPPEECNQELSTAQAAPGIGPLEETSSTSGSCS